MTGKDTQKVMLYHSDTGDLVVDVKLEEETVWLSQKQMGDLFGKDVRTINEHVKNIYKEGELESHPTFRNFRIVRKEGNREVSRSVDHYNLDMIISVGYRVNSKEGTKFRIWASSVLRDYLVKGYALNQKQLQNKGLKEFERAVALIKETLETRELTTQEREGLLEIVTGYSNTWTLLQRYDSGELPHVQKGNNPTYVLNYAEAEKAILELKKHLQAKDEASTLFVDEQEQLLKGVLGDLYQTFDGNEVYASVEEKAAHLLYFMIKDHPLVSENKQMACFLFVLFLAKNQYLLNEAGDRKFTDNTLVALALLIEASEEDQKDDILQLVMCFVSL